MGSAGFAATPKNIDIQILRAEGASGANLVFTNFRKACNDEISVTILGQTMTTSDSGNAGYAQGKVHQAVEEQMHLDDKLDVLSILNTDVVRILTRITSYNVCYTKLLRITANYCRRLLFSIFH